MPADDLTAKGRLFRDVLVEDFRLRAVMLESSERIAGFGGPDHRSLAGPRRGAGTAANGRGGRPRTRPDAAGRPGDG